MTQEINRKVVTIGFNFQPIPIDAGDGKVWLFNPDPDPEMMDGLMTAAAEIGEVGGKLTKGEKASLGEAIHGLKSALGEMLIENADLRAEWGKARYGLATMNAFSNALMEEVTGFTQASPPSSGKS